MPVFFVPAPQIDNRTLTITGPLLDHLRKSLRATVGEDIWVGDEHRHRYHLRVEAVNSRELIGQILEEMQGPISLYPSVILGQALLKGDRMDWLIQKATELGVSTIVPLISQRVIVRPRQERIGSQVERWQRIALEAAQQAECWDVPSIQPPKDLGQWVSSISPLYKLMLTERTQGSSLVTMDLPSDSSAKIVIVVGPEGGWTESEQETAYASGFTSVTLGGRILRAETAALAGISILQSRLGALG